MVNQVVISSKGIEVYLNITSVGQMVEELKAKLRKLIASNKIHEAIEGLKEFSNDNEKLRDEVLLIESRLSDLEEKIGKGVLDRLDEERINNQIRDSLVRLISRFNESDFVIFVENSEIVKGLKREIEDKDKKISNYEQEVDSMKTQLQYEEKSRMSLAEQMKLKNATIEEFKKLLSEKIVAPCQSCNGKGFIIILRGDLIYDLFKEKLNNCYLEDYHFEVNFYMRQKIQLENYKRVQGHYLNLEDEIGRFPCKVCNSSGFLKVNK